MKIKKIKLLKALALTSSLGIVATVPIIVSSCSTTSSNNGSSNGGNGSSNGGNGSSNGGNGGTDNGNGSDGDSTAKKTPQFQDSVTLIGSLKNIYDGGTTPTNDLLAADLKSENNIGKLLKNSNELGSNIKITVDGHFPTTSKWSGDSYDTWKKGTTQVYYSMSSDQIDISSPSDLYDKLNEKLSTIFESILGKDVSSTNTYSLTSGKNLGFADNLLHVSVTATPTPSGATTTYDLTIPVSDINLSIPNCSITVSGDNIVSTTKEIPITYNIGINSKSTYEGPTDVKTIESEASADSIMTALGLKDTTSKTVSQQSFTKITKDGDVQTDVKLNSEKLGQTIGIFNTTFSNTKVELDNSGATQAEGDSTNYLTYKVSFDGTPNENYYWDDGTNDSKPFSFDVKVNQKIATVKNFKMPTNASFKWEHAGVDINTTSEANITSTDTSLETKLDEFATKNTDNQNGIQKMLDGITQKLVETKVLVHAHVKLLKEDNVGYIRYAKATTGGSSKTWQIRLTAEPDIGYSAATNQKFDSSLKAWFDLSSISNK